MPWGCVAMQHRWKDPKLPDYVGTRCAVSKQRLSGALIAPCRGAGFIALCASDLPETTDRGRALACDRRITIAGVTCTSTKVKGAATVRCSGPHKASFSISRPSLRFHQPKGWK